LTNSSTSSTYVALYTNSLLSSQNQGPWSSGYSYIFAANSILEGLQNNGNIGAPIAAQLIGESKFLRAFWHFYLTELYGDVPVVLTTDYTQNESLSRVPQTQVYQEIISDLKDAQANLNTNYVDVSDTAITTERVRPTRGAATALLARLYLYSGKYDSAEAEATQVIGSNLYSLCTNLSGANSVFLKNSTEAIWQLSTPLPSNFATPDGQYLVLKAAPSTGTANFVSVSPSLLNAFEPNDNRKSQWIGAYTAGSSKYYYPFKYQSNNVSTTTFSPTEYVMVLRLAEQYLIRAEARAQQSNMTGAISDLNVIRKRAGLPAYAGTTDQASVLKAVLHERQVEMFTEWGNRWFDLIRTANIDAVMGGPTGVCNAKGGVWNSNWRLFPIPLNELMNDSKLTQNSGY
jgi:hypothetical protein